MVSHKFNKRHSQISAFIMGHMNRHTLNNIFGTKSIRHFIAVWIRTRYSFLQEGLASWGWSHCSKITTLQGVSFIFATSRNLFQMDGLKLTKLGTASCISQNAIFSFRWRTKLPSLYLCVWHNSLLSRKPHGKQITVKSLFGEKGIKAKWVMFMSAWCA